METPTIICDTLEPATLSGTAQQLHMALNHQHSHDFSTEALAISAGTPLVKLALAAIMKGNRDDKFQ